MKLLPIVERELRVASRKAGTYWLRSIAALVLLLIFFWAVLTATNSAARIARVIFEIMGTLVLCGCAVAGIFQTADCLSSEKREGTAGLLFLTDLRGHDVVLGKLAANSLHSCYGLLSILPIMALPLLMGGVTGGEFGRLILVLLATLFFSLSVGMLVSAVSREARQAMIITGAVIIFFNAILPGIYAALQRTGFSYKPLLWPGAGYAFLISGDNYYKYGRGALEFLDSLATISGIGLGCLLLASVILPRAWQEKSHAASGGAGLWQRLRFGSARRRKTKRTALLEGNPFYWLTARDRLTSLANFGLISIAAPLFLLFFLKSSGSALMTQWMAIQYMDYTTLGLGLVLKCLMAMEASRRLNDDRRSGALELLLVTPLSVNDILAGQKRALRRQFALPMLFLMLLFEGLVMATYVFVSNMNDPLSGEAYAGNVLVLMTDFYAMGWAGMWAGLRGKNHHRAVLITLARILVLPWLGFLLLALGGALDGPVEKVQLALGLWFIAGMVNDLFWARWARNKLLKQFRPCAASVLPTRPRISPIARLEVATA